MTTDSELVARYELACRLGTGAGRLTLEYFQRSDLDVERKSDDSPVTVADREAEAWMRGQIEQHFPDDGIVGEEHGERDGTSPFRWILDPIDGTKSFICGVPLYGTLIGVQRDEQSVAGVIEIPALGESISAMQGEGAWYRRGDEAPVRAQVSGCQRLQDARFMTSERKTFDLRSARDAYDQLEAASWITRTWGDCYGYLLVATGRADLMVDPIMSLWDAAALQPILEEAGGHLTDWSGTPRVDGGEAIGCNRHLLNEITGITRKFTSL